ncbi:Crp/Fnr family transcriptional regulator [Candidatus Magnetomonas plexicatena]|uniref:Crp/Fnr family transcriptional regulator n=1 Tax=Candidatus Magnetomonas plexicatena TaxID=2552947 RepID=UPI0011055AD2|nr:Crp/Fnr family transcriptional regulator [Nitrospirales bacterium LBB_01]
MEGGNIKYPLRNKSGKTVMFEMHPLFSSVISGELISLRKQSKPFNLKKEQTLYMQGLESKSLFFLESGYVKLSKINHDGRVFILDVVEPGEFFGELTLAAEKERSTGADAMEDCSGIEIRKEIFEAFLKSRPDLAIKLIQMIGDKRLSMESMLQNMIFMDIETRIASLLLKYADGDMLKIALTHQEIADMTGATRVSVSRTIIKFRNTGLIETTGERIKLKNLKKLSEYLERY